MTIPHNNSSFSSGSKVNFNLLLVDDDPLISQSIRTMLPPEWKMITVQNLEDINYNFNYHAAMIDMHLTGDTSIAPGLKVVEKLKKKHPLLDIFAISGDLSLELMEAGIKEGAQRFFAKPLIMDEILHQLSKVEALIQIRATANQGTTHIQWIGKSEASEKIRKQIANLRGEPGPILIEGESGCGKEVTARLLHHQESLGPLISINLAGIPETLFESELFGHVKGAFTGADQNKIGIIEAAQGGDLFLDEIEALPLNLQAKLLRFLESGEIKKVGSKDNQIINCRVICASNRDLQQMIKTKEFREDLYWRIAGRKILLPALRNRTDDIDVLAEYFLDNEKPKRNKKFSPEALVLMKKYSWPGNVRELKRVCEQISITSPLPIIRPIDIEAILDPSGFKGMIDELDFSVGLNEMLSRFESNAIKEALLRSNNDTEKASELLKISRSNLYKKIKDFELNIT